MKKRTIEIRLNDDQEMPIAMLVQVASQFNSTIHVESEEKYVNAKSIMGMMTVDVNNGKKISVVADGIDENEAIDSIEKYLTGQDR